MSRNSKPTICKPTSKQKRATLSLSLAAVSLLSTMTGCASVGSPLTSLAQATHRAPTQQEMMTPAPLPPRQYAATTSATNQNVTNQYVSSRYSNVAQVAYQQDAYQQDAYQQDNGASSCGCSGCTSRSYQPQGSWASPPPGSCLSGLQGCQADCPPQNPWGYDLPPQAYNTYGTDPQEFLCDGGDQGPKAVVRRDESLAGLGLEDTVVHYTTEAGDIEVQPSNRVCVYAPRFASVRKITGALAGDRVIGLAGIEKRVGTVGFDYNEPGLVLADSRELGHADVSRRLDAMRDRNRGVPVENVMHIEQNIDILAAIAGLKIIELNQLRDNELALLREAALAAVTWSLDESVEVEIQGVAPPTLSRSQSVEAFTVYDFPDAGRLQLCKLADRDNALPGEIVTFMLRVDNVGDSPVTDVLVTDNLTTRLEYVEDSQTASGGAEFSTELNDGQSSRLTWKLTDKLRVGESVTIRFKARVR